MPNFNIWHGWQAIKADAFFTLYAVFMFQKYIGVVLTLNTSTN